MLICSASFHAPPKSVSQIRYLANSISSSMNEQAKGMFNSAGGVSLTVDIYPRLAKAAANPDLVGFNF